MSSAERSSGRFWLPGTIGGSSHLRHVGATRIRSRAAPSYPRATSRSRSQRGIPVRAASRVVTVYWLWSPAIEWYSPDVLVTSVSSRLALSQLDRSNMITPCWRKVKRQSRWRISLISSGAVTARSAWEDSRWRQCIISTRHSMPPRATIRSR